MNSELMRVSARLRQLEAEEASALQAQVTHPVQEYTEARVERLVMQMEQAQRFRWPSTLVYNV